MRTGMHHMALLPGSGEGGNGKTTGIWDMAGGAEDCSAGENLFRLIVGNSKICPFIPSVEAYHRGIWWNTRPPALTSTLFELHTLLSDLTLQCLSSPRTHTTTIPLLNVPSIQTTLPPTMTFPLTPLYTSQTLTTLQTLTSKVHLSLSLCLLQVLRASAQPQPSATTAPQSCTPTTRWADVESGTWSWRIWNESCRCSSHQTCPTSPPTCHLDRSSHASSKGQASTFEAVQGKVQTLASDIELIHQCGSSVDNGRTAKEPTRNTFSFPPTASQGGHQVQQYLLLHIPDT